MSERDIGKRFGDCLKNLPPIMRACASCEKLFECDTGMKIQGIIGDASITEKVMKYNWIIMDASEFKKMSYEELKEYNAAREAWDKREEVRSRNKQHLTAGAYDGELKKWVTDVLSGTDVVTDYVNVESPRSENKGLTAGYWDAEKKRWVAKK